MRRIYCNKKTNAIEQIFNLTEEPELTEQLNEETFGFCYMLDVEDDTLELDYNLKYNEETEEFEINPDYVEVETKIEKPQGQIELENLRAELEMTQSAVDFLLMFSDGLVKTKNINLRGVDNIMAGYLSMRIIKGMLGYDEVIARYPEYKEDIDFILKAEGKEYLMKGDK